MDITVDPTSFLKRNLSFNDSLSSGFSRRKGGFPYASSRRKAKMKYQKLTSQIKAVALVATCLLCIVVFYVSSWSTTASPAEAASATSATSAVPGLFGLEGGRGDGEGNRFDRAHSPLKGIRNVIVVAGHSVLKYAHGNVRENESWYLEPYMEIPGQADTFVDHIKSGIELAANDPLSILLFSGGTTKVKAGPMTEAQSYWTVAEQLDWFGHEGVRHRAFTENFARDSFENLLFSICRFNELTSDYPETMTVVSYAFKEKRFSGLHRGALRYPEQRFRFVGSDYPEAYLARASEGESKVFSKFETDPYGVHGELKSKLFARDPYVQGARYTNSCPEIQQLMRYSGRDLFQGQLPWTT